MRVRIEPMHRCQKSKTLEKVFRSTCIRGRLVERTIGRVRGFRNDQPKSNKEAISAVDRCRRQRPDQAGRQPSAWLPDQITFKELATFDRILP
jgi:hypothetical protein